MAWALMAELKSANQDYRRALKYYRNAREFKNAKIMALKIISAVIEKKSKPFIYKSFSQLLINDKLALAQKIITEILNMYPEKDNHFDCRLELKLK